jgi:hypothetical protein
MTPRSARLCAKQLQFNPAFSLTLSAEFATA